MFVTCAGPLDAQTLHKRVFAANVSPRARAHDRIPLAAREGTGGGTPKLSGGSIQAMATTTSSTNSTQSGAPSGASPRRRAASGRSRRSASSARSGRSSSRATSRTHARSAKQTSAGRVGDYAERAILIPVGAALIARDRFVSGVEDAIATYSSSTKIEAQLRRFERRGGTARRRLEREVRKTRTRVERGVRERRRDLDKRSTRFRKDLSNQVEQAQEQFEKTQAWIGDTFRSRVDDTSDIAGRVQERVLSEV
jgi:hypothetical protein